MSSIVVGGLGAVSPAGWGVSALHDALLNGNPVPFQHVERPGWTNALKLSRVPAPTARPLFFAHPRLRRASDISLHVVGAAIEALGEDLKSVQEGTTRIGILVCTMVGSVAYLHRFYEEVMRNPATASPLLFPETVFNAPASHLAAFLATAGPCYTMVGDDGTFLQALAVAADWLSDDIVDGVVVVGAEEIDWAVTEAVRYFQRNAVHTAGAGALYLRKRNESAGGVTLASITDPFLFTQNQNRHSAARKMRQQLPPSQPSSLLCESALPNLASAMPEKEAWSDWKDKRLSPKSILGEAFVASAAWQCVASCKMIQKGEFSEASVSIVGLNQQAIGAHFIACTTAD